MVMGNERDLCSTCNSGPGDRTTVTFTDAEKSVDVRLCEDCYRDFSMDEGIDLSPADE